MSTPLGRRLAWTTALDVVASAWLGWCSRVQRATAPIQPRLGQCTAYADSLLGPAHAPFVRSCRPLRLTNENTDPAPPRRPPPGGWGQTLRRGTPPFHAAERILPGGVGLRPWRPACRLLSSAECGRDGSNEHELLVLTWSS